MEDDLAVTALLHRYGALAFWDMRHLFMFIDRCDGG